MYSTYAESMKQAVVDRWLGDRTGIITKPVFNEASIRDIAENLPRPNEEGYCAIHFPEITEQMLKQLTDPDSSYYVGDGYKISFYDIFGVWSRFVPRIRSRIQAYAPYGRVTSVILPDGALGFRYE